MIIPKIWKVIKFMFQTTNQITILESDLSFLHLVRGCLIQPPEILGATVTHLSLQLPTEVIIACYIPILRVTTTTIYHLDI